MIAERSEYVAQGPPWRDPGGARGMDRWEAPKHHGVGSRAAPAVSCHSPGSAYQLPHYLGGQSAGMAVQSGGIATQSDIPMPTPTGRGGQKAGGRPRVSPIGRTMAYGFHCGLLKPDSLSGSLTTMQLGD
jgi:hypothetical protein